MRTCDHEGCDRKHYAKGYCLRHYMHLREYGTTYDIGKTASQRNPKGECSIEGCDRLGEIKGLCRRHYARQWAGKDLYKPIRRKVVLETDENGRVCTRCGEWKPWDQFYKTSGGKRRSQCRTCVIYINTQYKANKEKDNNQ